MIPENASPKLTEQLAAQFRAQVAEYGLVLAARCRFCHAPIWAPKSLAQHAGPICQSRNAKSGPGPTKTDAA